VGLIATAPSVATVPDGSPSGLTRDDTEAGAPHDHEPGKAADGVKGEKPENAIEAPFIIYNEGYYWLFVSWDYCCRGKNSTYRTVYGRSRSITGPYLDMAGKDMAQGGGTLLIGPSDEFYGIGHCSVYRVVRLENEWYFVAHAYDANKNGNAHLFMKKLTFSTDGIAIDD
jgi:arabinan endo-1,5-alpha-L-arabinosidase